MSGSESVFPGKEWERIEPADAGLKEAGLAKAMGWLKENIPEDPYRVVVVRGGRVAVEWYQGLGAADRRPIASAAKSLYSNVLGIMVREGKPASVDDAVFDYYPELMDVPEGFGPKEGRYAFPKDRDVTFRQLIGNTSGYMKPGENPGTVFNYQTFGMNILTHSLAAIRGLYDTADPEGSPGFKVLVQQMLGDPIGAELDYSLSNFDLHKDARLGIFGYYTQIHTTALDAARIGWLWRCGGLWRDQQVIPQDWLREATRTSTEIVENCPEEEWQYGYGFWTNDHGKLWPDLPRDGFTASGAGGHYVSVFPSLDLVVAQNPGLYRGPGGRGIPEFLGILLGALR
jgi:CubicO group peptidase (beta-lactamase class C family)